MKQGRPCLTGSFIDRKAQCLASYGGRLFFLLVPCLIGLLGCSTFLPERGQKPRIWEKTAARLQMLMPDDDAEFLAERPTPPAGKTMRHGKTSPPSPEAGLPDVSAMAQETTASPTKPAASPQVPPPPSSVTPEPPVADDFEAELAELIAPPSPEKETAAEEPYSPRIRAFLAELETMRPLKPELKKRLADCLQKFEASEPAEEFAYRLNMMLADQRQKYGLSETKTIAHRPAESPKKQEVAETEAIDDLLTERAPLPPESLEAAPVEPPPARKLSGNQPVESVTADVLPQEHLPKTPAEPPTSHGSPQGRFASRHDREQQENTNSSSALNTSNTLRFARADAPGSVAPVGYVRENPLPQYDPQRPVYCPGHPQADPNGYVPAAAVYGNAPPGHSFSQHSHRSSAFSSPGLADGSPNTHLQAAAEVLRQQIASNRQPNYREEAQLRLIEGMLGNRREAARPVTSLDEAERRFWSNEVLAIATFLEEGDADPRERVIATARHAEEGLRELQVRCPLKLRNMQFVNTYEGFGRIEPSVAVFAPGEAVTIYFELENVTVEETRLGYRMHSISAYEIRDEDGMVVQKEDGIDTEDLCKSRRRDHCIAIKFSLPGKVPSGKYYLHIETSDQNHPSRQSAEDRIPFRIGEDRAAQERQQTRH